MFRIIFAGPVYQLSLQEIFFHFIEEIGEVSEALADATTSECLSARRLNSEKLAGERKQKLHAIAEELADVFSWSVGIMAKVQALYVSFEKYVESRHEADQLQSIRSVLRGSQHISLAGAIWQKYGLRYGNLRCDDCNARPCKCVGQRAQPLYKHALNEEHLRILLKLSKEFTLD
jgi:NTP pyrophosphatase (non-canonical NTP hydrolase)